MTIVGVEKLRQGGLSLLVFDPKYYYTEKWDLAMERALKGKDVLRFLRLYRRGVSDLKSYREFEIIMCLNNSE